MSIDKVEVRNVAGTLLTLELDDITDGFILEDIEGIDPVKATLVSSSFANLDGSQYQSARRENRNIVLKIGMEPYDYSTQSVRALRKQLYQWFMPKSQVNLRFYMSDGLTVAIVGRVEDMPAPLFTQEPRADISIVCFDPDFLELTSETISDDTVSDTSTFTVSYEGTVETGILFTLNVDRTLGEFTIYNTGPDGITRSLDFQASMVADDVIKISTVSGNKYATLTRASTDSSVLYGISPQANWITLMPGDNVMRVAADGAAIPFTIEYTTRHGGL
jgi:hypothetical protein